MTEPKNSEEADVDGGEVRPDSEEARATVEADGVSPWIRHSNLGLALTIALGIGGFFAYQLLTWPDVAGLAVRDPETTAFISRHEAAFASGEVADPLRWRWVPYDSISVHAKRAVVAAEDIGFFSHNGFAVDEIRVVIGDALAGDDDLRGASTITQQVAKNLWLSPSRNPLRKAREALLTRQLEERLSKWRILEIYLNVAEFGPGVFGVEAAAQHFFGVPASELSEGEAAQLAASLPRPASWHPGVQSGQYIWYVGEVERRLERAEFLWRRVQPQGTR